MVTKEIIGTRAVMSGSSEVHLNKYHHGRIWNTVGTERTRWRSWARHCAKSWKVLGSISDGVIGIFH